MSEENNTPKITLIKKEKDPKCVEASKKLAIICKQSKERKMCQRNEAER